MEGSGVATIDGIEHEVEPGCTIFVPGDAEHGIRNTGTTDLRWLYVFPTSNFADVVYMFSHEQQPGTAGKDLSL